MDTTDGTKEVVTTQGEHEVLHKELEEIYNRKHHNTRSEYKDYSDHHMQFTSRKQSPKLQTG
jgi:hypothetical protein